MTLCIFLLTLFCIFMRPFRLRIWIYTSIGATLCLMLSGVDSKDLETIFSLTWDSSLTLIALIILSYSLEELGFFRTLVAVAFAKERAISTFRLFSVLAIFCACVSMVLSNDGAILVMTPLLFSLFANITVPKDRESSPSQDNAESTRLDSANQSGNERGQEAMHLLQAKQERHSCKKIIESTSNTQDSKALDSQHSLQTNNTESKETKPSQTFYEKATQDSETITKSTLTIDSQNLDSKKHRESSPFNNPQNLDSQYDAESTLTLDSTTLDSSLTARPQNDKGLDSVQGFAQSNNLCEAPNSRPLRGAENRNQGGSSASADLELEAEIARHSPRLRKKTQRVASEAKQKSGALSFCWLGRAGRGETLFSFALTSDFKKSKNIRENENLKNEQIQNLDSTQHRESSPINTTQNLDSQHSLQMSNTESNFTTKSTIHTESTLDSPPRPASTLMYSPASPVFFAFLFTIAFVCDATSNALIISNLTNIITAHYFALPFLEFFLTMLVPNVCVLASVLVVFYLIFRRTLPQTLYICRPTQMRMNAWLFVFCIIVLLAFVGAFFALERYGLPLCVPSLIVAVLFALIALAKSSKRTLKTLKNAPYGVLIFSFGLYIIVFALHREGLSSPLADMYAFFSDVAMGGGAAWEFMREYHLGLFGVGFISMLGANICNNLPMTLFGNLAINTLADSTLIVYAHLLACNIGAKLTPIGSLATLLWVGLCAQRGYHIGFWQYMRYSLIFTPLVLVCAIGGLLVGARLL